MAPRGTKALAKWCQTVTEGYEGVNIVNMSTSWRSGLGFCAIIHRFRPDLIDFDSLDPDDALSNNALAFRVAEQHLGVPALLDPKDVAECEMLDRLSILTYLSQFYQAFHGATQPAPPRRATSKSKSDRTGLATAATVLASARRLHEPCKVCGKPVDFIMERLNVDGRLLHRTCFRCARCGAQLNIHSYYETEAGDYCCDVCPDEEKTLTDVVQANKIIVEEHLDDKTEAAAAVSSSSSDEDTADPVTKECNDNSKIETCLPDSTSAVKRDEGEEANAAGEDHAEGSPSDSANGSDFAVPKISEDVEEVSVTGDHEDRRDLEQPQPLAQDSDNTAATSGPTPVSDENEEPGSNNESEDKSQGNEEEVKGAQDDDVVALTETPEEANNVTNEPREEDHEAAVGHTEEEAPTKSTSEQDKVVYPEDMNPFGQEDDDNDFESDDQLKLLHDQKNNEVKKSNNPFGSDFSSDDDDNEDEDNQHNKSAISNTGAHGTPLTGPPKPPRASLNPFGSDFEDDDEEKSSRASPSSIASRNRKVKRPAPKPPGPSPRPVAAPRTSLSAKQQRPPRPPPPSSDFAKERKERDNHSRRSQMLELTPLSPNKATSEGQWKKKKGPAPPRPIPQKRQVKKLPRKAVNTELYDIEIKQQELERQGVKLEKTIRELCERNDRERAERGLDSNDRDSLGPEVEDLIVQLFDLVNEKNDLFRRQTELMYMKRDHRLEEEHADIEHQVRMLMARPDSQRTDDDKVREERLIARLMEVVAQRNEIVDCLEMDRLREIEEDESFEMHMGEYAAVKPNGETKKKKEKKRKKNKKKEFDADKDIDTSEIPEASPKSSPKKVDKEKTKKFKKKLLSSLKVPIKKA